MHATLETKSRRSALLHRKALSINKRLDLSSSLTYPPATANGAVQRKCACGGACPACSNKNGAQDENSGLQLSKPTDKHEIDADRLADSVMQMQIASSGPNAVANIEEEEEETTQAGAGASTRMQIALWGPNAVSNLEEEEEETAETGPGNRGEASPGGADVQVPNAQSHLVPDHGRPLEKNARAFMEPRFGANLGNVRIHTGMDANQAAESIGARAFTVGNNIVFAHGEYGDSSSGRRVLAHELAHVIQQRAGRLASSYVQRLGATPGCTPTQRTTVHDAIRSARGWLNKAIAELGAPKLSDKAKRALRRNFGPAQGAPANAPLIHQRLKDGDKEIGTIPFSCNSADPICVGGSCGFATVGSHQATVCNQSTLAPGAHWIFQTGCVLHESFHARYSNFTHDFYSGWHGHSSSTPGYPGAGIVPLLNADSYATIAMDLS